jgi:hypothetical protein
MRKLWVLAACLAVGATQAATFTKPAVTLELPDGWVEVPQQTLDVLYAEMKRQSPLGEVSKYDYAFQASAGPPWLKYPYVLVKVRSTGRPTREDLEGLPAAAAKAGAPGPLRYDGAANIVWMSSRTEVANVGEVGSLSAFIPTERGFVDVHGYAPAAEFPSLSPVFEKIMSGAVIAPELRYRADDAGAAGSGFGRLGWLAAIAVLIAIGVGIYRRRQT